MSYDFVTFGRTKLYYIDDDLNIDSGVIDIIQPVNPGGADSPDDIFVVRHKETGTQNEYVHINLKRKDVRFDYEEAKDLLIETLKKNNSMFGVSVDSFFGDVVDGVLQARTPQIALNFAGVTEIGFKAMQYAFYQNPTVISVDFSSVQSVAQDAMYYSFYGATNITNVDLSSLTTIGFQGFDHAFYDCTGITGALDLSSLQNINGYGLTSAFYNCAGITGALDLSSVTSSGDYGLSSTFEKCKGITSVDLSSLTTIGYYGLSRAFVSCTGITGALDLSSLTTVSGNGLYYTFLNCAGITSVDLSSLTTIASSGLKQTFCNCIGLTTISFPSLTSVTRDSFATSNTGYRVFDGCTNLTEIHFRADMQVTIEACTGYTSKFGATNATIYFDL